jgi:23S rRNA (uracil1939-C5)-methyltransferase
MRASDETTRPKPGQIIEGEVTDLAYGGAGVLRAGGWVVMVRGAFPQDRVRARVRRRRQGVVEADLIEVLHPAPHRVAAPCPHVALCGGCALQGLDPAAQTRYKARQATELLRRIGKVSPAEIAPPWQSPAPFFYRNKMEFTFGKRPWLSREALTAGEPFGPGPALGLHPRGVYQGVFDVTACQLQSPLSNQIVGYAREIALRRALPVYDSRTDRGLLRHLVIRQAATRADLLVILVVRNEDPVLAEVARELMERVPEITGVVACINLRRATVASGDYLLPLGGRDTWCEEILGLSFRIGAASFFQTQTRGAVALIEEVLAVGSFSREDRILDLYCGIGAFSLPIARVAGQVCGIELLAEAVAEARQNAAANGIDNAAFEAAAVEAPGEQPWESGRAEGLPGPRPHRAPWDTVLLDPPRSGLHPRALDKLRRMAPPRIIYVSCNPATLARDAGTLVAEDGYHPRRLRIFDLFPQTPHLEAVMVLERRG